METITIFCEQCGEPFEKQNLYTVQIVTDRALCAGCICHLIGSLFKRQRTENPGRLLGYLLSLLGEEKLKELEQGYVWSVEKYLDFYGGRTSKFLQDKPDPAPVESIVYAEDYANQSGMTPLWQRDEKEKQRFHQELRKAR